MPLDFSETTLKAAFERYEDLFSRRDVEAILADFTDDARVRYGSLTLVGKDSLRAALAQRFSGMRDYRLAKRLELVSPPRVVASWTGSWIDVASGARVESFGLELLTIQDGRICEWVASVSVWHDRVSLPIPLRR